MGRRPFWLPVKSRHRGRTPPLPPVGLKPTIELLRTWDGDDCWSCGDKIEEGDFSVDHICPRSRGGADVVSNARLAHRFCNQTRGASIPHFKALPWHRIGPPDEEVALRESMRRYLSWWRTLGIDADTEQFILGNDA